MQPLTVGSNDEYNITIEDVNIADPGVALTAIIEKKKLVDPDTKICFVVSITDEANGGKTYHSEAIFQSPGQMGDTYFPVVIPFEDPNYEAGRAFAVHIEVVFPVNPEYDSISIPIKKPISGEGGRFDYIDIPYMLKPGDKILPGQYFRSRNNQFYAIMNYLGNFNVRNGLNPANPGGLKNTSNTKDLDLSLCAVYQKNGNFCLRPVAAVMRGESSQEGKCAFPDNEIPPGASEGVIYLGDQGDMIMELPEGLFFNMTKYSNLFK